ncbi:MAG TPA: BamA/TamA family outer membrane protein [Vicinamibacterales bacterium]|nr:BamA/TamA family outer membrane protein [Vicinamibacterales bacterium]
MCKQFLRVLVIAALMGAVAPAWAFAQAVAPIAQVSPAPTAQAAVAPIAQAPAAQAPAAPAAQATPAVIAKTACGSEVAAPAALPPAGSPPFIWILELCFDRQGGASTVESETYQYYIKLQTSRPSQGVFVPYDDRAEQTMLNDFKTLWGTSFLEDLSIEITDHTFPNGVVGKLVVYRMEERERVKIVDYRNVKGDSISIIKRSDIDEKLREKSIEVRLDSFLDDTAIRRVKGVLRELMAEKGFTNAEISHQVTPVAGGPKLVNVTFTVGEGPKIKIRDLEFVGNAAIGDGALQRKMKENKPKGILSFITGGGTYKEAEFEEDAAKVVEYYHNKGYPQARVGNPEIKPLEDAKDGKTRWVQLRIPVTEGHRYQFGDLDFEGNKLIRSEGLRTLYKIAPGDWYSRKRLTDGNKKAQEIYGSRGYMEFTPFPMMKYSDDPANPETALAALVPAALVAPPETETNGKAAAAVEKTPVVNVTMQITEGPQYFVNRITFTGNTTTRDNVIRREMRLVEGGVFDTESLKYSVRRLNQLGYFKELKGDDRDMDVKKTTGAENTVDVTMKFEEQNRNQLTFGAGVSQYEGVFGQLAFQTSNFLGRGESLTVSMQAGDRAQNYQLAFTEPFLFDRNITGGFDVYKRSLQYIGYYTQKSTGGNLTFGFPVADFSRMFINYAYETVRIADLNEALIDQSCLLRAGGCSIISSVGDLSQLTPTQVEVLRRNPFVYDSLLVGQGGRRAISKVVPTFVHNTVDNPIFPNSGKRLTASIDLAVLGGNTNFYKPRVEAIWFHRHLPRTSVGVRALGEYIAPLGSTTSLPIFERLFLGGEYSVRGFDIRSIGPTVPGSPVVLGGNKSLVLNAEYLISIMSQVRIVLFADAGQVRDFGQGFGWKEDLLRQVDPPIPALTDPFATSSLVDPNAQGATTEVIGRTSAFKTSTGVELRFFMPVLNVPFRLIYSFNPSRAGVLDNSLQPAKKTTFRFAVGTTF